MLSLLRPELKYKDISSSILEHDIDLEADQWSYDGRDVYRGLLDPDYISHKLNVYWLYDDNSLRVGLVEHESESPEIFKTLWYRNNAFSTFFQDDSWVCTDKSLWSLLSNESYQDCLEQDFRNVEELALNSGVLLLTPEKVNNKPAVYYCEKCKKKSFTQNCSSSTLISEYSTLFLDDNYIIHTKQHYDASEQEEDSQQPQEPQEPQEQAQPPPQPETPE
jgi:hypothetical protein